MVTIRLPLVDDTPSTPATDPAATQVATTASLRGHETVLCVEDEPSIRAIVERTLAAHGYQVLATGSGEEALAAARQLPHFDLLLTDVIMSGMHGGDLARAVRASHPHVRVLFMSGYAADRLDDHLLADSSLLQKPYTPRELLERVREVLDGAPPAAGPRLTSR